MTNAVTCKQILCPYTHPRLLWWDQRSKQFILNVDIFQTKMIGMEHRTSCKHIFCPYTHPRPLGWGQMVKTLFLLKVVMLHIKLDESGTLRTMQAHILSLHTPSTPRWG